MKTSSTLIHTAGVLLFGVFTAQANIGVYVSAPEAQKASGSFLSSELGEGQNSVEFLSEGFENFEFGQTTNNTGVYSRTDNGQNEAWRWVQQAGLFGGTWVRPSTPEEISSGNPRAGAEMGDAEKYLTADPQGQVITITFGVSVNYFGFFWTAGSGGNRITLYNDENVALGSFDTSDLVALLPNTPEGQVTAINGSVYNTADFYNQPGTGDTQTNQAFAFLHFINHGDSSNSIKKVVLEQVSEGGGFESDNHTVSIIAPLVSGSNPNLILVKEQIPEAVPEPSSVLLMGGAGAVAWYLSRRKRSRR